jgi:hypothetical protein
MKLLKRIICVTVLFCSTSIVFGQNINVFKTRILGTWEYQLGYICGVGFLDGPDTTGLNGKTPDNFKLVFLPDETVERYKNDTLIASSKFNIVKVQTFPNKVAFKLKSNLFKGEVVMTYYYNDYMVISACSWEEFNVQNEKPLVRKRHL